MTERALQRKVMSWLRPRGQFVNKSPSQWDRRGIPDIIGVYHALGHTGPAIAIELKKPDAYSDPWDGCTAPQKLFLQQWANSGGLAIVADSLETVQKCLANRCSNIPNEESQ